MQETFRKGPEKALITNQDPFWPLHDLTRALFYDTHLFEFWGFLCHKAML